MRRRDLFMTPAALFWPVALPVGAAASGPAAGIIFIGASWCPVCKQAASVLAALTEPARIPVLVASHDGRHIPPFPQMTDARNHPVAAKIITLPTTLVYSQKTNTITSRIEGYRNARHYARNVSLSILALQGRIR